MATKREIEIAKKVYAWPMDYNELELNTIAPLVKLIDSIPRDIEEERKEFEEWFKDFTSGFDMTRDDEFRTGYKDIIVYMAWDSWKAARGIE